MLKIFVENDNDYNAVYVQLRKLRGGVGLFIVDTMGLVIIPTPLLTISRSGVKINTLTQGQILRLTTSYLTNPAFTSDMFGATSLKVDGPSVPNELADNINKLYQLHFAEPKAVKKKSAKKARR